MKESNLMRVLQVCASKLGARVFRNNVGLAWIGKPLHIVEVSIVTLYPGDVVLRKASPVKFGLGVGSSDLIGWQSVPVTPDMVGKSVALFVAIEVKTDKGSSTEAQENFIAAVLSAGGKAGITRSEEDTQKLLAPRP